MTSINSINNVNNYLGAGLPSFELVYNLPAIPDKAMTFLDVARAGIDGAINGKGVPDAGISSVRNSAILAIGAGILTSTMINNVGFITRTIPAHQLEKFKQGLQSLHFFTATPTFLLGGSLLKAIASGAKTSAEEGFGAALALAKDLASKASQRVGNKREVFQEQPEGLHSIIKPAFENAKDKVKSLLTEEDCNYLTSVPGIECVESIFISGSIKMGIALATGVAVVAGASAFSAAHSLANWPAGSGTGALVPIVRASTIISLATEAVLGAKIILERAQRSPEGDRIPSTQITAKMVTQTALKAVVKAALKGAIVGVMAHGITKAELTILTKFQDKPYKMILANIGLKAAQLLALNQATTLLLPSE